MFFLSFHFVLLRSSYFGSSFLFPCISLPSCVPIVLPSNPIRIDLESLHHFTFPSLLVSVQMVPCDPGY